MQLTRKQVRTIRQMFRRAFGLTARSRTPTITLLASSAGLRVQAATALIGLEYHQAGQFEPEELGVPYQALLECEGTRSEPVTFQEVEGQLQVEWTSEGIPVTTQYPLEQIESFPEMPLDLYHNDPQLLTALRDASETTEKAASRYALDHLRLRGSDGQIASTDGRQALVQTGFTFTWEEALLVPATGLFAAKEFQQLDVVKVGRTENWVTFQFGSWTLHLKINQDVRFPHLDDCIPDRSQAITHLHLDQGDAEFLTKTLGQLPAADHHDRPITIDLNGAVTLRAQSENQPTTEVTLTNSHRTGEELRVSCNRDYLVRAAKLGFRDVHLSGQDTPVLCQDDHRRFIWALFAKGSALAPNSEAIKITSPGKTEPSRSNRGTRIPTKDPAPLDKQLNQLRKSLEKILVQIEHLQHSTLEPTPSKPLEKAA